MARNRADCQAGNEVYCEVFGMHLFDASTSLNQSLGPWSSQTQLPKVEEFRHRSVQLLHVGRRYFQVISTSFGRPLP